MVIKLKKCSQCGEDKPISEFYNHKPTKSGLRPDCKKCANLATKIWVTNNREKVRLSYNYYNTGITPELYTELLNLQNGGCAICGKTARENRKNLAVDHDHKTMKVRGLLCNRCNLGIGYLEDKADVLKSAARYIENPPLIDRAIDFKPRKKA